MRGLWLQTSTLLLALGLLPGVGQSAPTHNTVQKKLLYLVKNAKRGEHTRFAAKHRDQIWGVTPKLIELMCRPPKWQSTYFAGHVLLYLPKDRWESLQPLIVKAMKDPKKARRMGWFWQILENKHVKRLAPGILPLSQFSDPSLRAEVLLRLGQAYNKDEVIKPGQPPISVASLVEEAHQDKSLPVRRIAAIYLMEKKKLTKQDWKKLVRVFVLGQKHTPTRVTFRQYLASHPQVYPIIQTLANKAKGAEKKPLQTLLAWAKPVDLGRRIKLAFRDPKALQEGKKLYLKSSCASCHKKDGTGLIGSNLTDLYSIYGVSFVQIYKAISKGGRPGKGMLGYRRHLSSTQLIQLTAYVASLMKKPKAGLKPEPAATKRKPPPYLKWK